MSSIQDSVYNWLTIKVVCDARPDDFAAVETEAMFRGIMEEEHGVTDLFINKDEEFYLISYIKNEEYETVRFPRDLIEVMLNQINESPDRYKIYPE
jgi:hypothetical protein